MVNYASESSIHGISFIFGENRSKFVRVLWIFLLFASLCGFSYYFKLAYTKWSVAPDITIKIIEKGNTEIPFPAFTICPMRFSRADQIDVNKFFTAMLEGKKFNASQAECEYLYANLNWCKPAQIQNYMEMFCKEHFVHLEDINILDVVNRSAYQSEDLFTNEISQFYTRILTSHGFCFNYNMQDFSAIFSENIHDDFKCYKNEYHPEIEWNVERGYFNENSTYPETALKRTLVFATMMNPLDANNACGSMALSVYLHLPNEMPSEHQEAMQLNYGSQTSIRITAKSHRTNDNLRSYSPDIRKCYFDGERKLELFNTYTKSHCILECRSNEVISACGCVKFNMPRNKTTRVCRLSDMKCLVKIEAMMEKKDKLACGCLPSCNDIKYTYSMFRIEMDPKRFGVSIVTMGGLTRGESVEEMENFLAYTLTNFISDVGGLLGLFVGCSLLSILEVFYFLFAGLIKAIKNRIGKQGTVVAAKEDLKTLLLRIDELSKRIEKL